MRFLTHSLLACFAVACAVSSAAAQDQRAQLTVIVADTLDAPVPGVRVAVNGVTGVVTSDSSGVAVVSEIPLGTRMVSVEHPSYRTESAVVQFPSANHFRLRIALTPTGVPLDTVTVTGRREVAMLHVNGFYRRQREGMGSYVTRETLDELDRASPDLSTAFMRMLGFRVERNAYGLPFIVKSSRGEQSLSMGECFPSVRVNGMMSDMEELSRIRPGIVEAIEAYANANAAPAEYSDAGAVCGLILVWLRRR